MRVTFPQMAEVQILLETILHELGVETVSPPPINGETVELGVKYAPEFICYPFKMNLGNYLQALQRGADTVLMAGGCGPCRFGNYAEVQQEILRGLGYDVKFIILEPPRAGAPPFWRELLAFLGWRRMLKLPQALGFAWKKLNVLEEINRKVRWLQPREAQVGNALALYRRYRRLAAEASLVKDLALVRESFRQELAAVPRREGYRPLRILLAGEIYMVLEPNVNFHVEETLGRMDVEVHRAISISNWVKENLLRGLNRRAVQRQALRAEKYLRCFVGGHGRETVAEAVHAGVNGYDGMVQIMPFTCMPELVAQSILPEVGRDYRLPVMTLILDEHSGEAGVCTRLEAFVDLIRRGREKSA
ncbi:MAG TPA: CoA protein activase [Firmicutes bacterium]|nr:CoA protein activase [Bacillota bacterium]HOQ23987.1 CoA protein activase [Bacillota bacterium]HPT67386.1 CoA protein activase [Bacillota bacterium]